MGRVLQNRENRFGFVGDNMTEQKRLGDIATYINGFAFKPENRGTVGLPIIRIQDLTGNAYDLGFYDGSYPKQIEINDGDVLISWSASLGVYIWNRGKALLNQHIFKVAFDKCEVNREYFVYAVRHKLKEMESKTHGATMKHIVKKDFDNTLIPFPTLSEQGKIAELLDTAATIISARQSQLQKLDELVKARFIELFGDPATNPYGWQQLTVNDVCVSVVRGPFGSALKKEFFVPPSDTTYKVYEQKHAIQKSSTIGTYYVTAEKYNELRRFECHSGDILMSCSGTMGELYQLPAGCERGIINQALCKFTLNERILPIVFWAYMRETIGNLEIKGSSIQNIAAVSYVKAMPINLPPMRVQEQYATFVEQTDKSKVAIQKALDEAQLLFDSLMQKYFG